MGLHGWTYWGCNTHPVQPSESWKRADLPKWPWVALERGREGGQKQPGAGLWTQTKGSKPNMGRGTACCTGQDQMEADSRSLMFHPEGRGLRKYVVKYCLPYVTFLKISKEGHEMSRGWLCCQLQLQLHFAYGIQEQDLLAPSKSRTTFSAMLLHCSLLGAVAHKVEKKRKKVFVYFNLKRPKKCFAAPNSWQLSDWDT